MSVDCVFDIPPPQIYSNSGNCSLDMRLVWYALHCIECYPCMSSDIRLMVRELGAEITGSRVGSIMSVFCQVGYFRREQHPRFSQLWVYKPCSDFLHARAEWLRGKREMKKDE